MFVQARDGRCAGGVPAVGGAGRGEAGADGVVEHVVDGGREVVVGVDQARGKAVAPEVAGARVLAVEALGVEAVEAAEPVGERLAGAGEDDVHVVRHQAEREDVPAVAGGDVAKERQEGEVVGVVAEHGAAVDASRGDVVDAVGEEAARRAGHASTVARADGVAPLWGRIATLLARSTWLLGPRTRDCPWFSARQGLPTRAPVFD